MSPRPVNGRSTSAWPRRWFRRRMKLWRCGYSRTRTWSRVMCTCWACSTRSSTWHSSSFSSNRTRAISWGYLRTGFNMTTEGCSGWRCIELIGLSFGMNDSLTWPRASLVFSQGNQIQICLQGLKSLTLSMSTGVSPEVSSYFSWNQHRYWMSRSRPINKYINLEIWLNSRSKLTDSLTWMG